MRQHRIYLDQPLQTNSCIEIAGETNHYLQKVLRIKSGYLITLFNGLDGYEYQATIGKLQRNTLSVDITDATKIDTESPVHITLVQAISKGDRVDWVVQKSVELGVQRIVPVVTNNNVVKLDADRKQKKQQHWQKIAEAACCQSGRVFVPEITPIQPLSDWLQQTDPIIAGKLIALSPTANTSLHQYLADYQMTNCSLIIGPEGGLTDNELAALRNGYGCIDLSMGPRILRTETAAVAALTLMQAHWGDL